MKVEQISDEIRLQDADLYSIKNTLSLSQIRKLKEIEEIDNTIKEFKARYNDQKQYKEVLEDILTVMLSNCEALLAKGYGNDKVVSVKGMFKKMFDDELDDMAKLIEDHLDIKNDLEEE